MAEHATQQVSEHPARFGAYRIERVLGEGTMGRVYQARHQTLGRRVAIKALHPALTSDRALVRRFLQEARVVNTVKHPHIIECYDFVEDGASVFAVMELLEGETLTRQLAAGPLAMREVLTIAAQIADALEAAHAVNVLHRDIKPDNLLVCRRDGELVVKVLDFGLAKLVCADAPRLVETQVGTVMGTPLYMAPEQLAGLDADARADLYAWATVVYEMVAGCPPFTGETFATLVTDVLTKSAPPLPARSRSGEPVPEGLRRLVADCLGKKPRERPASMREVRAALSDLGRYGGRSRWRRRAVAAGVLVLAGGAVLAAGRTDARAPHATAGQLAGETVTIELVTNPDGAMVSDASGPLGTTPLSLRPRRGGTPLLVRIEREGYAPVQRQLSADRSLRVELELVPVPRAPLPVIDGVLEPF